MSDILSRFTESFLHSRVGIPAPRHLPRYTVATMHPRQYDFTGNFFPSVSLSTSVLENTYIPLCAWNFTDTTLVSNPIFQIVKVQLCTRLQRFIARCYVQDHYITARPFAI